MKKIIFLFIITFLITVSCSSKNIIYFYKMSLLELTNDNFSKIFPDDFLYTKENNAGVINITKIKGTETEYEDSYTFDSKNGFLKSTRIYSDGDYYISEFKFDKSNNIIEEKKYLDNINRDKMRLFLYNYNQGKEKICDVTDNGNNIIRNYKIINKKKEVNIQTYNNSRELTREISYFFQGKKINVIIVKSPRINTVLSTKISYEDGKITNTEYYNCSKDDICELLLKKKYFYGPRDELLEIKKTIYQDIDSYKIEKIQFKNHDAFGNWIECQYENNEIKYQREINYWDTQR